MDDIIPDPGKLEDKCGTGYPNCGTGLKCDATSNKCISSEQIQVYKKNKKVPSNWKFQE